MVFMCIDSASESHYLMELASHCQESVLYRAFDLLTLKGVWVSAFVYEQSPMVVRLCWFGGGIMFLCYILGLCCI